MPTPPDLRKKPTSVKIGIVVDITGADGHPSHYEFAYLRDECPCATCNDAREKKAALGETASTFKSSPALPMFKPKPRAQAATQVGNYAIQTTLTAVHSTGSYSYNHLRSICPCAECAKAFRTGADAAEMVVAVDA